VVGLAAVLIVTGPTVIGPLVRAIGLRGRPARILEAEGTLIESTRGMCIDVPLRPVDAGAHIHRRDGRVLRLPGRTHHPAPRVDRSPRWCWPRSAGELADPDDTDGTLDTSGPDGT